jgi:hypothetical protein
MTPPRLSYVVGEGNALNRGSGYDLTHGPGENFGVHNGQFDQGPSGQSELEQPEGWTWEVLGAGATLERVTGGWAGNWCMKGGNPGNAQGGYLRSQKFMPVSESYVYCLQVAAYQTGNATARFGVSCYSAAKAMLTAVYTSAAFIPAAGWTLYTGFFGASGVAFTATTRYVRVRLNLQMNAALTGAYVYVDDVKLHQVDPWLWALIPQ